MTRRPIELLMVLAVMLLTGCGVRAQTQATPFDVHQLPATPGPSVGPGSTTIPVYFVRDGRLVAVERSVAEHSVSTALGALVAGPRRQEVAAGLRTAVPSQSLVAESSSLGSDAAVVAVTPQFTEISGANQLLAVAQLVWTVTEVPGVTHVSITVDGTPLEVPTDDGLSRVPVARYQYTSVAPEGEDASPTPVPTPSTTTRAPPTPTAAPVPSLEPEG